MAKADGLFFGALGIAVVSAEDAAMQALTSMAGETDSGILAVEPEYRAYALHALDRSL